MEKIGTQKIWTYCDEDPAIRPLANQKIRAAAGHRVATYIELAKKVAELQFRNRDHVLMFRGQVRDYATTKGNSMLKASMFRHQGKRTPDARTLEKRYAKLQSAESLLVEKYTGQRLLGFERLKRQRILRWAILQHYEVCATPLLDVTQSLRIAASFASLENEGNEGFLYVLGVPNISGAITASSEASIQVVRLSSACPPEAIRPHLQEGYLLGEYPELSDFTQNVHYPLYEMDFGRRLVAKFRFSPVNLWRGNNFPAATSGALYPHEGRDLLLPIVDEIRAELNQ